MTPNAFATIALLGWPLVVLAIYASSRGRGPARPTAWAMFLGNMFLPSSFTFKVPGIPGLDKHRMSALAIALALEVFHWRPLGQTLRANRFGRLVLAILIWGTFQTVRTNGDVLVYGPTILPGLDQHDAISISLAMVLDFYLPFAIGVRVFREERDLRDLFHVLSTCALIYVPLCLFEIRMSPQLHTWVYGYFPHEFGQMMRGGSFRPVVFMNHGLVVASFMFSGFLASLALRSARLNLQPSPGWRAVITGIMTLLCRSLGAILYAAIAFLVDRFVSSRNLARGLVVISAVVLVYPVWRASGTFPRDDVLQFFDRISKDRAASLGFRLDQEEQLLARARERPLYGWGSWGRNHIYAPWGQRISIADGHWVIMMGAFGYVGFFAFFALLLVPLLTFVWKRRRMPPSAVRLGAPLALMLGLYTFDLIPNSLPGFAPITYAGALLTSSLAFSRRRFAPARRETSAPVATPTPAPAAATAPP